MGDEYQIPVDALPLNALSDDDGGWIWPIWTIFKDPLDHPGKWVLRCFDVKEATVHIHPECVVADSLEEVRASVPAGRICFTRHPNDDPAVYESWI